MRATSCFTRQRAVVSAGRMVWRLTPATTSDWTPRELRHSFVSLLSDAGVPLEDIAQLVGHSGTTVTELVTGTRSGPSSKPARRSWIGCSDTRLGCVVTQLVTHRAAQAGVADRKRPLTWVGDTGFEPVTSSV